MTDKILSRVEDGIGRIVFNQPEKRNAVSLEMWEGCERALEAFEGDGAVRVVVFEGAGDKAFVSGADISKFESERASEDEIRHYNQTIARVYGRIQSFPKPTIAQITGACVGGGVALAVCCDLRIAGASSRFAIPAAKLGLGYGFVGIKRLVDVVGVAFAKEIFFTARMFDAEEARLMGLVNRIVPDGEVAAYVEDYAARIAANAPLTVMGVKAIANETVKDPAARDLELCKDWVDRCYASADYVEGRRAFMEKRKPAFTGS